VLDCLRVFLTGVDGACDTVIHHDRLSRRATVDGMTDFLAITEDLIVAGRLHSRDTPYGRDTAFIAITEVSIAAIKRCPSHTPLKRMPGFSAVADVEVVTVEFDAIDATELGIADLLAITRVAIIAIDDRSIPALAIEASLIRRTGALVVAWCAVELRHQGTRPCLRLAYVLLTQFFAGGANEGFGDVLNACGHIACGVANHRSQAWVGSGSTVCIHVAFTFFLGLARIVITNTIRATRVV